MDANDGRCPSSPATCRRWATAPTSPPRRRAIERRTPHADVDARLDRHFESPFFSAKLDPARGIITSLVDKHSGRELAGHTDGLGLGQYLYERFDKDPVMRWCTNYVRAPQALG